MAGEDSTYTEWLRLQPCAMCGTRKDVEVHHPRWMAGMRIRGHDHTGIPLCKWLCHVPGVHQLAGLFKGWTKAERKMWEHDRVKELRERYLAGIYGIDPSLPIDGEDCF